MTPHYWHLFAQLAGLGGLLLLPPPLNRDLARIQGWCNHWCMILNPTKIKALAVSRSIGLSTLPRLTWSCLGFSFALVPTLTFLAWSLTASSPSKTMCVVSSPMFLKEFVIWGWWSVFLWTPLCCFVATMHLFSQSLSIVLRWGLLLNVIFRFSSARCIRWLGFAFIRLSYRCVIDVVLLHCVCCTRLIRTRIIVCPVSFHLLLSEFDIPELWLQLIH